MNETLRQLIRLNIELEGALRVAADRPGDESLDIAKEKFEALASLFATLGEPKPHDMATIVKEDEAVGAEESPLAEPSEKDVPPCAPIVENDSDAVEVSLEEAVKAAKDSEEDTVKSTVYDLVDGLNPQPEQEPAGEPGEKPVEEPVEEPAPAPVKEEPKRTPGDIRKLLTLNDKFLFRRELFDGSDTELSDTLDLIASMHSLEEAEEYVYDDLQWDPETPAVRDFMAVIAVYFNQR